MIITVAVKWHCMGHLWYNLSKLTTSARHMSRCPCQAEPRFRTFVLASNSFTTTINLGIFQTIRWKTLGKLFGILDHSIFWLNMWHDVTWLTVHDGFMVQSISGAWHVLSSSTGCGFEPWLDQMGARSPSFSAGLNQNYTLRHSCRIAPGKGLGIIVPTCCSQPVWNFSCYCLWFGVTGPSKKNHHMVWQKLRRCFTRLIYSLSPWHFLVLKIWYFSVAIFRFHVASSETTGSKYILKIITS